MTDFASALREGILVCDGAMGTMLHAAGNSLDRALPELNLANAELVSTIHESYLSAGVDVIQTNTFGASRLRLAEQGSNGSVRDITLAGVRIARAEIALVNRADQFGVGEVQLGKRPVERVARGMEHGPHGAVADQDGLVERGDEVGHGTSHGFAGHGTSPTASRISSAT